MLHQHQILVLAARWVFEAFVWKNIFPLLCSLPVGQYALLAIWYGQLAIWYGLLAIWYDLLMKIYQFLAQLIPLFLELQMSLSLVPMFLCLFLSIDSKVKHLFLASLTLVPMAL